MLKKFFISLSIILSLSFTSCGSGSSKEARELLSKILQFVGIPHNIIVNVCQDKNGDGVCGDKEIFTKLTIKKGESVSDILRKISLTADGRYFLETYDPDIPILVELHDPKNIKYDNGNFTLKFKGFKNHEQNEIKEISAIQSLEDAGYLTADETKALKALENREAVDRVIFESLENNYNRLRDEKLPNKIAVEKGLESVALGLQTLDIQKELPTKLDSCANDNSCIKEIVTTTSKELNITKEEAEVIADEVKKDKKPKTQKNIADGYIAHLSSPIEAKCSDGSHFTTTVGLKGSILFDRELDDSCEIIVPSSAIIDSNNNGKYDKNSDKAVGFTMRGLADGTFITPLTTLLLDKQAKGEDVTTFKAMVKDFNPVSSASAVGLYTGDKKNRVQKLMLLMEVLKTAMKEGADVSSIDLAQIISNIPFKDMDLDKLLGGVSDIMKSKIMDSLNLSGVSDLISQLDTFDKSKVDLNTLMVNVSDGGIGVDDALEVASKVPVDVVTPTPMPTLTPVVIPIPTPTPTPTPVVTPTPTLPPVVVTPTPTPIVTPTPTPVVTPTPTPVVTPTPTPVVTPTPTPVVTPTPTPVVTPTPTPTQSTAQTFKSTLKKTGQTTSYEQFDDGDYQIGISHSYSRSGEIVTDNITKLQWQDNEEAKTVKKNWEDAKSYCSALSLGGKSDWRLPTPKELMMIVDNGKYSPALDSTFVNVTTNIYLSSTTRASDTSNAWVVFFDGGSVGQRGKTDENSVRCVRE